MSVSADGRRIIDPPCELGHTRQAMECPSCSERVTGSPAGFEWWSWYRTRNREAFKRHPEVTKGLRHVARNESAAGAAPTTPASTPTVPQEEE